MPDFLIREIGPDDNVSGLSFGTAEFEPLKRFLRKDAKRFHAGNVAKTYVALEPPNKRVIAYITLICSQVHTRPPDIDGYLHNDCPAVKIARLAVSGAIQKSGLGRALVQLALAKTKDHIMPHVGCRFLMVDAKKPSVDFYSKVGFTMLDTTENRSSSHPVMFIDLAKLP